MVSISDVVEDTHIVCGVIFNLVLLYAIRRFTKKALGSYKQLLTIFASFDVFLTIIHSAVKPHVVIVGTTFGVAGVYDNRSVTSFYASCFTVPFALMNIHFLFRFWSIRRPDLIPLFSVPKFIAFLTFFPVAEFIIWYALCDYLLTGEGQDLGKELVRAEYKIRYGREQMEGWLMMNHWENGVFNLRIFIAMCCYDAIMIVSFSIASALGYLTFYYIQRADTISTQALNVQFKLFIAVCAQTFVPLVFVYIPYFCVITFPFFHLPIWVFDHGCMFLTACFPAWDAVIMILLMKDYRYVKDYREGLLGMTRKKQPMGKTTVWKTATSQIPSTVLTLT